MGGLPRMRCFLEPGVAGLMRHGARRADGLFVGFGQALAGPLNVRNPQGKMPIRQPMFLVLSVPVVGEFNGWILVFIAVPDKCQGEAPFGVLFLTDESHTK